MQRRALNEYNGRIEDVKAHLTHLFRLSLDKVPPQFFTVKNSFILDVPIEINI